jgi:hypothetical protein
MSDKLRKKSGKLEKGQESKEAENIVWEEIFFDESGGSKKQDKGVKDAIDRIKEQDVRELMDGFRSQEQGE